MSLFDQLLAYIVPYDCLLCGVEGSIVCKRCLQGLTETNERCYTCLLPSKKGLTCATCRPVAQLTRVQSVADYSGVVKDLLWALKSGGSQAAIQPIVQKMAPYLYAGVTIVPVPTATSRVRQRGYDQAVLLARALAGSTNLPYRALVSRHGQSHQVGASRDQRLQQLKGAYYVRHPTLTVGRHIVLIDDVLTTGATLESAATALLQAGAARVDALTFARA